ncbi:MAG: thymidine phosphorylase, partial [Acidimicrobiia bacterium]|nr:thymidine phosphorylase [Acidimicrobiia bacterium]
GAGRERKEDQIDPGVGITLLRKIGDPVTTGDTLARVRFNDSDLWESQREGLGAAWTIGDEPVTPSDLVLERIESD